MKRTLGGSEGKVKVSVKKTMVFMLVLALVCIGVFLVKLLVLI